MDVTPLIARGQQIIQNYAAGLFKVSGISYEGAVIVSPEKTSVWETAPADITDISFESFAPLLERADEVDVLLFGTGATMQFIPPKLRQALSAAGLSIDVMDTGAACRTYNVLMAEGRRVIAVMMPTM